MNNGKWYIAAANGYDSQALDILAFKVSITTDDLARYRKNPGQASYEFYMTMYEPEMQAALEALLHKAEEMVEING